MNTAMERCAICQLPVAPVGVPWGYAGPVCHGHYYGQPMVPSEETIRLRAAIASREYSAKYDDVHHARVEAEVESLRAEVERLRGLLLEARLSFHAPGLRERIEAALAEKPKA